MAYIQIDTMADYSEVVHYDTPGIPLYIRKGQLSCYPGRRAVCHWHDELEIILILSGEMNYYINGEILLLKEGEAVLVNTREMHYGFQVHMNDSEHSDDCVFICILFHPVLLSSCKPLFTQQVDPFLKSQNLTHLHFVPSHHSDILGLIRKIWEKKEAHDSFYEFDVISLVYSFWSAILRLDECNAYELSATPSSDVLALRKMVSFIHEHYHESLSLQDIADSASICRSKCCSVFSKQIHQSPFDFLNNYRLQISTDLLTNSTLPITKIAFECGFNHSSYYSKLFYRLYKCTPGDYRKNAKQG